MIPKTTKMEIITFLNIRMLVLGDLAHLQDYTCKSPLLTHQDLVTIDLQVTLATLILKNSYSNITILINLQKQLSHQE